MVGIISGGRLVTGWKDSGRSEHLRTNVLLCSNMPAKFLKSETGGGNYFWRAIGDGMEKAPDVRNI